MKINQEYLKKMLNVFLSSEKHFTELTEFKYCGFNILDDDFIFHFKILQDQGFVESCVTNRALVCEVNIEGRASWKTNLMRLTASGHDFAESLNKVEIFEILSKEFKDVSISTLSSVARELMLGFAKKQISKYFDPNTSS